MADESNKTTEHIVTKQLVDSVALYVYAKGYGINDDPVDIYNSWLSATGVKLEKLSDAVRVLEKISGFLIVPREDMAYALRSDNLI